MRTYNKLVVHLLLGAACVLSFSFAFIKSNPGVASEKTGLVFDGMGYDQPGVSIYRVVQTDGNSKLLRTDTLGLYHTVAIEKRTLMQWQFVSVNNNGNIVVDERRYDDSYTINEVNDSELFIHPPRDDCFRILQCCPYPFFRNNAKENSWNWDFEIGWTWATPPFYPIKKLDTFHISYALSGNTTLQTTFGKLDCREVTATSNSVFGKSTAQFFLNNDYGIVRITITANNMQSFRFELLQKLSGTEAISSNKPFASTQKRRDEKKNAKATQKALQYIGVK